MNCRRCEASVTIRQAFKRFAPLARGLICSSIQGSGKVPAPPHQRRDGEAPASPPLLSHPSLGVEVHLYAPSFASSSSMTPTTH